MSSGQDPINHLRRRMIRDAAALALASSPLAALAAQNTGEGVTFADGP